MITLTLGFEPYYPCYTFFDDQAKVQLNPSIKPLRNDDRIIGFHCQWRDILFEDRDVASINKVLQAINPDLTLRSLADVSGIALPFVQSIVQTLYELDIIHIISDTDIGASAFLQHMKIRLRGRRHGILQQNPLLTLHNKETITKKQLVGYLIEAYHFSSAASSHISLAVAQAPNKEVEAILSRYLAEEYWHGTLLARGIAKAGVTKDTLETIAPTFPILGIINYLRHIARTDLQAYGLCIALTESPTSAAALQAKKQVWDSLKAMKLVPAETLDVFYEHDIIDHNAQHDEGPAILFPLDEVVSPKRQHALLNAATLYIDMIGDAYQTLKMIYADPDGPYWHERS